MAKKVIERIIKVFNIIANSLIGFVALVNCIKFGTDGTMYSDDPMRIVFIVAMALTVNAVDGLIRNHVRNF